MSINEIIERVQAPKSERTFTPTWSPNLYIIAVVLSVEGKDISGTVVVHAKYSIDDLTVYERHLAVAVWSSDHRPFQYHRFTLGSIIKGRFIANISPRVEGQREGDPVQDEGAWAAMHLLINKAKEWQENDAKDQTARYMERQSHKATQDKAPPTPNRVGKTERDRAKGKARPKAQ